MCEFIVHTPESAPSVARESLKASEKAIGFIPNMHGVMAEQPALLEAYKTMVGLSAQAGLTTLEQQVVFQVCNFEQEGGYCMAVHSEISDGQQVSEDITEALRRGTELPDERLEALAQYTRLTVRQQGWVDSVDRKRFYAAGFASADALAVVLLVSMKVMSNYTNHIAETPIDQAFKHRAWVKPVGEVAAQGITRNSYDERSLARKARLACIETPMHAN